MGRSLGGGDRRGNGSREGGVGEIGRPETPPGVIDRALAVLDVVELGPRTLAELVEATGLPRATAHRTAVTLERHGLLRRDPDGRFALGLRLLGLGRVAAEQFPLREASRPALETLRDDTGESVQLYVAADGGRRCVASLPSPHALRWIVAEGALLPLDRGSAGAVLTGRAGPSGWVASVEEREPGVASVSAAVRGPDGAVLAAVGVSGPVERLTRQPGRRFGPRVVEAARQIGAVLAGA